MDRILKKIGIKIQIGQLNKTIRPIKCTYWIMLNLPLFSSTRNGGALDVIQKRGARTQAFI